MAEGLDINELTFWFYVQNHGFIDQVTEFARKHANEFKEKDDGHSLKETSLHAEFQQEFESKVQEFVDSKGSTMADLQTALQETTVDGDDPAAEVLVNVMLSMLDFELFAKTMREMAAEDELLLGTSASILTEEGAVAEAMAVDKAVDGLWKDTPSEQDKVDGEFM